eukprot:1010740-Alexandrium_andersonii.AAC.1
MNCASGLGSTSAANNPVPSRWASEGTDFGRSSPWSGKLLNINSAARAISAQMIRESTFRDPEHSTPLWKTPFSPPPPFAGLRQL